MEQDKIIDAIESGEINAQNISFAKIRQVGGKNYPEIYQKFTDKNNGTFGRKPLISKEELEQYIYQYGLMIEEQWKYLFALSGLNLDCNKIEIIDYACGQGLASILFFDKYPQTIKSTSKITLVEPSEIALDRAKIILQCYNPNTEIKTVNKKLDDIVQNEIQTDDNATKIHLFSNILDIDDFNIVDLLDKIIENKGVHHFLAVSHDRNFEGGSKRLKEVYDIFRDKQDPNLFIKNYVIKENFKANDKPAICFHLSFEV